MRMTLICPRFVVQFKTCATIDSKSVQLTRVTNGYNYVNYNKIYGYYIIKGLYDKLRACLFMAPSAC